MNWILRNCASTVIDIGPTLYLAAREACTPLNVNDVQPYVRRVVRSDGDEGGSTSSLCVLIDDIVVNFVFTFNEFYGSSAKLTALTSDGKFYDIVNFNSTFARVVIDLLGKPLANHVRRLERIVAAANATMKPDYYLNVDEYNAVTNFNCRRLSVGVDGVSVFTLINTSSRTVLPCSAPIGVRVDGDVPTLDVLKAAQVARYDLLGDRPSTFGEVLDVCRAKSRGAKFELVYEDAESAVISVGKSRLTWLMIDGMPTYITGYVNDGFTSIDKLADGFLNDCLTMIKRVEQRAKAVDELCC